MAVSNTSGMSFIRDQLIGGTSFDFTEPIGVEAPFRSPSPTNLSNASAVKGSEPTLPMPDVNLSPGTLTSSVEPTPTPTDSTMDNSLFERSEEYNDKRQMLVGAKLVLDVTNANNAYTAASGQARINMMLASNQAADALFRGRQRASDALSEGMQGSDQAALLLAAQGQDINSAQAQKLRGSYEAMGAYNAMTEEVNAMREALGYELQEVAYQYQEDNARISRDSDYLNAGLSFAAESYRNGVF